MKLITLTRSKGSTLAYFVAIVTGCVQSTALAFTPPPAVGGADYDDNIGIYFELDVGAATDTSGSIFIDTVGSSKLSDRLVNSTGITYREISSTSTGNGYLRFKVDASSLALSANGVPYTHALIEITYMDTVNDGVHPRPRMYSLVNFGDLEWTNIGLFAGKGNLDVPAFGVWKTSTIFNERTPWQAMRTDDNGYFGFSIKNPATGAAALPIDRVKIFFVSEGDFYSEREVIRANRGFIRADYIPTNTLDPNDYPGRYFVTFTDHYMEKIYANYVPSSDQITQLSNNGLSLVEIAGQREPVMFAIYALSNLENVTVQATDLIFGDATIPAANISINPVAFLDKRWRSGYSYSKYYANHPWYLDDNTPFDVSAFGSKQVWVTVSVPADTPKGTYQGTLTVNIDGQPAETIPLSLVVHRVNAAAADATPHSWWSAFRSQESDGIPPYSDPKTVAADDMIAHQLDPIVRFKPSILTDDISWPLNMPPENVQINFNFPNIERQYRDNNGQLGRPLQIDIRDYARGVWNKTQPGDPYLYDEDYAGKACPKFDRYYTEILRKYKAYFEEYWQVAPVVTFVDEPNAKPQSRRVANHLNGLAKAAGLKTWNTYSTYCERPVAGHTFELHARAINPNDVPSWVSANTSGLQAYWDFESVDSNGRVPDLSGNQNHGNLSASAAVSGGSLVVNPGGSMQVYDTNSTLDLTNEATISLWVKPTEELSVDYKYILGKYSGTTNYLLQYTKNGTVRYRGGTSSDGFDVVSGSYTLFGKGLNRWYNILWVFDSTLGGTLYVNGRPCFEALEQVLVPNNYNFRLGYLGSVIDEVFVMNRALNENEIADALDLVELEYENATISATIDTNDIPSNGITFSIYDYMQDSGWPETQKGIKFDGIELWDDSMLDDTYGVVTVDADSILTACTDTECEVTFGITGNGASLEDVLVYFHDDVLRNVEWTLNATDGWEYDHEIDSNGASAPMDENLDRRVYALSFLDADEIDKTAAAGDELAFYTTGPATDPTITYNRFLNGIYASAVGATSVSTYSYGGFGGEAYDDMRENTVTMDARGWTLYNLVQPSWQQHVYPTLPYEALREGIEDSRIIATLKEAIANSTNDPLALEAQDFLDELYARPSRDFSDAYRYQDESVISTQPDKYADRSEEILEDLCLNYSGVLDSELCQDQHDYSFFDRFRVTMIEYILKLADTDEDGIKDWSDNCQDHANAAQEDCDSNGIGDVCQIAYGFSNDVNSNGIPDECDVDCNTNSIPDDFDIAMETSSDCNTNGIPDECDDGGNEDCNSNGSPDFCDILGGTSNDCNGNGVPDECETLPSGTLYVDDSATGGLNDGSSWTNAYLELEDALDHARCAGGTITTIEVAQGTYYPDTTGLTDARAASFQLIDGVEVKGGYAGYGAGVPEQRKPKIHVTILSGDIGVAGDSTDNCYHVLYHREGLSLDETAILDGVTVTGGNANGTPGEPTYYTYGGGMLNCYPSKPTLINCTFQDNKAYKWGGAICNYRYCHGEIVDCIFNDNVADGDSADGGAIYNYLSSPTFTRCLFNGNTAEDMSGAVHSYKGYQLFTNCKFLANTADGNGGAMYAYDADIELVNCIFSGNSTLGSGGAVKNYKNNAAFKNCSFYGSTALSYGGALDSYECNLSIANSIIWGSSPMDMRSYGASVVGVSYSCLEDGYAGLGNISSDPLFVDPEGQDNVLGTADDNLTLGSGSPCIDAASNSEVPADGQDLDDDQDTAELTPVDLAYESRFVNNPATVDTGVGTAPIVDMGAYEYWPDCNSNGVIDYVDITAATSTDCDSNGIPDECAPDCNANGIADMCDIASGSSPDMNTNGIPDECEPARPVMTAALSRKGHGTPTVYYSIPTGSTECRQGGISQVKFCFDSIAYSTDGDDFVAGDFTLSQGTISNITTAWNDGFRPVLAEITLDISGVTTMEQLTISFSGENYVGLEEQYEACWDYIPADVDDDGDVDNDDRTAMQSADGANMSTHFRFDLDLNGTVEGAGKVGLDWFVLQGFNPTAPQALCGN